MQPGLKDHAHLADGDVGHHSAPLGQDADQVLVLQLVQRLADGGAAGVHRGHQLRFAEDRVGHVDAVDDVLFDQAVGLVFQAVFCHGLLLPADKIEVTGFIIKEEKAKGNGLF